MDILTSEDWMKLRFWTPKLARSVLKKVKPGYFEPDDVEQELYMEYVRLSEKYDPNKPGAMRLLPFLWKYASMHATRDLNRRAGYVELAIEATEEGVPYADFARSLAEELEDRDDARLVREKTSDIPHSEEICDGLSEGRSLQEIADKAGIPKSAVRNTVDRMRKAVRA